MKAQNKLIKATVIVLLTSTIATPAIFTLCSIHKYGVNVLFGDEWVLVFLLQKNIEGTLTFSDLFAQHNEHRILFPNIVMLGIARLTNFNSVAEMYFSWILSVLAFAMIIKMYEKDLGFSISSLLMFLPVSFLFFTPRQYENIFWGWQIELYMALLGIIVSIYFLNKTNKLNHNLLISLICGIVVSFSFMSGLLIWIIGVIIIIAKKDNKKILLTLWATIGFFTHLIYFWAWDVNTGKFGEDIHFGYYHPKIMFNWSYFITSIGSPLSWDSTDANIIGSWLLVICAITLIYLFVHKKIKENVVWISLVLFSLLSSIMLTLGRSGYGIWQAMGSRYTTFTLLGIIGIYVILLKIFYIKYKHCQYISVLVIIVLVMGIYSVDYKKGIEAEENLYKERIFMKETLLNYKNISEDNLSKLRTYALTVKIFGKILEDNRLNVFSEIDRPGNGDTKN